MIVKVEEDIFISIAEALVNPVNTLGVAGNGLAREFKLRYYFSYLNYRKVCMNNTLTVGSVYCDAVKDKSIIYFPTKIHYKDPSKLEYISKGLKSLKSLITKEEFKCISVPYLGCGLGGLDNLEVENLIYKELSDIPTTIFLHKYIK